MLTKRMQVEYDQLGKLAEIYKNSDLYWVVRVNDETIMEVQLPGNYPASPPAVTLTRRQITTEVNIEKLLGRSWLPGSRIKEILIKIREQEEDQHLPQPEPQVLQPVMTPIKIQKSIQKAIDELGRVIRIQTFPSFCLFIKADQQKETVTLSQKPSCGLYNCGNRCYMNTVVQLLSGCQVLRELLVRIDWPDDFLSSLSATLHTLSCCQKRAFSPTELSSSTTKHFSSHFTQEDSYHYLNFILNRIHTHCPQLLQQMVSLTQTDRLECSKCKQIQFERNDEVWNVELYPTKKYSDWESLWERYQQYVIEGRDCKTAGCKSRKHYGTIRMQKLPLYLIAHLNWNQGGYSTNRMTFPEVSKFKGVTYHLRGYAVHSGYSGSGGHYYARLRNSEGRWKSYNDSDVKEIPYYSNQFQSESSRPILVIYESEQNAREFQVNVALQKNLRVLPMQDHYKDYSDWEWDEQKNKNHKQSHKNKKNKNKNKRQESPDSPRDSHKNQKQRQPELPLYQRTVDPYQPGNKLTPEQSSSPQAQYQNNRQAQDSYPTAAAAPNAPMVTIGNRQFSVAMSLQQTSPGIDPPPTAMQIQFPPLSTSSPRPLLESSIHQPLLTSSSTCAPSGPQVERTVSNMKVTQIVQTQTQNQTHYQSFSKSMVQDKILKGKDKEQREETKREAKEKPKEKSIFSCCMD